MAGWTGSIPEAMDADDAAEEAVGRGTLSLPADIERPVRALLIGATQWNWTGVGWFEVPRGIDYSGLRNGLALAGLRLTPLDFEDVRTMEKAALVVLRKRCR